MEHLGHEHVSTKKENPHISNRSSDSPESGYPLRFINSNILRHSSISMARTLPISRVALVVNSLLHRSFHSADSRFKYSMAAFRRFRTDVISIEQLTSCLEASCGSLVISRSDP